MTVLDCIKKRRSVRTFSGEALREADARSVMEFAGAVSTPYGLPIEWLLLDARREKLSSPVIAGEAAYIAGRMRRAPHAEEAFGYAFEQIVLFACTLGVGTTWIAGTMDRSAFERAAAVGPDEVMPCVSPLGYPAKKMSLRESVMRKGVRADSRFGFGELFFENDPAVPLTEERAGELLDAFEAVRLAPSAVNKQPWRIVLCGDRARFYKCANRSRVSADGWDIQKIDMGIALCHFALAAAETGVKTAFEIAAPEIAVPENWQYIASYRLG